MNPEHPQTPAGQDPAQPAVSDAERGDAPWRSAPLGADALVQSPTRHDGKTLPTLLAANGDAIARACDAFERALHAGVELPPAAGRLLDHYHLLDGQVRLVRGQLHDAACQLPVLAPEGEARAWRLVLDALARGDGAIDPVMLSTFLRAYQEQAPLALAELDALPALLRLALLDNLRRLAARAERACAGRAVAGEWIARLLDTADTRPGDLILLVADMARAELLADAGFVAELGRRLHGRGGPLTQVLDWIDARLNDDNGGSIARYMQLERSEQADDATSVGNSLASLRLLGGVDWRRFAEDLGTVDALLRTDPDGSYPRMDGATRALYRQAVMRLARDSGRAEADVAQAALDLAAVNRAPGEGGLDARTRHVGYYLAGPGIAALEARLGSRRRRARARHPGPRIGLVALLTMLFVAALVVHARQGGAGWALMALVGLLALPGASEVAQALLRLVSRGAATPAVTPRMDVEAGIPASARTVVAVHAQASHAADLPGLCEGLEVRYLGNRDPRLRFCLLLDLADAAQADAPGDTAIHDAARAAIDALNRKYAHEHIVDTLDEDGAPRQVSERIEPFLLLVRARTFSDSEQAWIGRERRRGQLHDLNAWLCGAHDRFALAAGNTAGATEIRYVISLDADTLLPRDGARSLVAAMSHPLHQPFQDAAGRMLEGHGMLWLDTRAALPGRHALRLEHLWPGDHGGWAAIHDVDAWRRALGETVREEGRAEPGLVEEDRLGAGRVPDLQLASQHPGAYGEAVLRRHRSLRAAWQEAWRLGRGKDGLRSLRARWRLFDQLRAGLVAPASTALLLVCWCLLAAPVFWGAAVLAVFFLPALLGIALALAERPIDAPWRQHLEAWGRAARAPLQQAMLCTAFLPHAACYEFDALVRGLWRRHARRSLLEWRPAGLARPSARMDNNWRTMWFAPLLATGTAVLLTFANPYAVFASAPLLLVWFLSPVLAWWSSQAAPAQRTAAAQVRFLRTVARRTWAFFEDNGAGRHGLTPDTVAEQGDADPDPRMAPASAGLALLAALGARDFGYLPCGALVARAEQVLAALGQVERWHGHPYQTYTGVRLAPLEPAYVDTAASGSLVLSLRTFAAGLDELPDRPVMERTVLDGIRTALEVVREHAPPSWDALQAVSESLAPARWRATDTLPGLAASLRAACAAVSELKDRLPADADPALRGWVGRLAHQCTTQLDELQALAPWMRAEQEYVLDARLTRIPTLRELARIDSPADNPGLAALVDAGRSRATARMARIAALAVQARALAQMDFAVLVDPASGQLATGCHVRDGRLDADSCDLLASGARMASFAAVAQGQLPQQHWWSLGRPQRMADGHALLLSRSGALEDFLASRLVMPGWRDTLLETAARSHVAAQAAHARRHGVPWGFTESGCNAIDAAGRHRIERFGLPAAALQRRADDDLVAAPHAAALALAAAPHLAIANLQRMAQQGLLGETGFHEALDLAPGRLPQGERQLPVRTRSARHQAMTLLALAQHLLGAPMQRRFCRDLELRAALELLQEAPPARGAAAALRHGAHAAVTGATSARPYARVIGHDSSVLPEVQLLSNGRYHLVQGSDGRAASRWEDAALTAPDLARAGMACHVRDIDSGQAWSNTLLPSLARAEQYEAVFAEGRASFRRLDHGIETITDVAVAPDHDVELRRIRIVNRGAAPRTLELTSCVDLAGPPLQDGGRSGVQCEFDAANDSLLCLTTPEAPVLVHRMVLRGVAGQPSGETDRARFIGRGNDDSAPQAVRLGGALAGVVAEPDAPLLALRRTATLAPQQELVLDLILGVAGSRAVARELARRYGAGHRVDHAIEAAWIHAQAFLRRMEVSAADAQLYTRLAGCLLQAVPALRADPAVIARNVRGRADLAPYGVSGVLPLLVLQAGVDVDNDLARQVLQAHAWWGARGLAVDLLVLCDGRAAREALMHLAMPLVDPASFDQPGGVHLHLLQDVPQEDRILLRSSARVLLATERGDLADQLRRAARPGPALPPPFSPDTGAPGWRADAAVEEAAPELVHDNGIGGFAPDGREYLVRAGPDVATPPTPWLNPLSNPGFGSVIDERGEAYSWCGERGLRTSSAEAFYLRDEDSGAWWSPTPWPAPSGARYLARHGLGYSVFTHRAHGIGSELRTFVASDAPLKYTILVLRNDSDAARRLCATGFVDWMLDAVGATPGQQVVTGADLASGALFARNAFGAGFHEQVAFFHVDAEQVAHTCDRAEFIGPQGAIARPAALARSSLSGTSGAGIDPCAALQVALTLAPGETRELVFVLGVAGPGSLDASRVVQRHGGAEAAAAAWKSQRAWWNDMLGAMHVATPDPMFDARVNGWLPCQALGAMHGEADPALRLQSALALTHARPELLGAELLGAARAFSLAATPAVVDFLWLPFALARYLAAGGDLALLGERPLAADGGVAGEDDLYLLCVHGLRGCLRFGARGLPPAAARLHDEAPGRGESVRLGFFMAATLGRFAEVADRRGDFGFATTCRGAALALKAQCEEHGWDGQWYRWVYLDNGNVLGASANPACRVDLETQAWAVLAGAAQGAAALRAACARLHDADHDALRLCEPPVDGHWSERVEACPGQDHRATALAAIALAQIGDARLAWQLLGQLDPLGRHGASPFRMGAGVRTMAPYAGRVFGDGFGVASAWTRLLAVDALLGVRRDGARLRLDPRLPPDWEGVRLRYRHRGAIYEITVRRGAGPAGVWLDGRPCPDGAIDLQDDRRDHTVEVRLP